MKSTPRLTTQETIDAVHRREAETQRGATGLREWAIEGTPAGDHTNWTARFVYDHCDYLYGRFAEGLGDGWKMEEKV
jgi:hypothetical protein